jgi:hypothetical protein
MKSASFGSSTSLAYDGRESPDLQCAQNAAMQTLAADVNAILAALEVRVVPKRRISVPARLLGPNTVPTAPAATASPM